MPNLRRAIVIVFVLALVIGGGTSAYFLFLRNPTPSTKPTVEAKPVLPPLPAPGSDLYDQYAQAFFVAVAAMDEEKESVALAKLNEAIEKVPGEPAGWANRGLLHLRHNRLAEAAADLRQAQELAPDSAEIERILGRLAERNVQFPEAASHYRKA